MWCSMFEDGWRVSPVKRDVESGNSLVECSLAPGLGHLNHGTVLVATRVRDGVPCTWGREQPGPCDDESIPKARIDATWVAKDVPLPQFPSVHWMEQTARGWVVRFPGISKPWFPDRDFKTLREGLVRIRSTQDRGSYGFFHGVPYSMAIDMDIIRASMYLISPMSTVVCVQGSARGDYIATCDMKLTELCDSRLTDDDPTYDWPIPGGFDVSLGHSWRMLRPSNTGTVSIHQCNTILRDRNHVVSASTMVDYLAQSRWGIPWCKSGVPEFERSAFDPQRRDTRKVDVQWERVDSEEPALLPYSAVPFLREYRMHGHDDIRLIQMVNSINMHMSRSREEAIAAVTRANEINREADEKVRSLARKRKIVIADG